MRVKVFVCTLALLPTSMLCTAQGITSLKDCVTEATTPPYAEQQQSQPAKGSSHLGASSDRGQATATTGVRG